MKKNSIQRIGVAVLVSAMAVMSHSCVWSNTSKLTDADKEIVHKTCKIGQFDKIGVATGIKVNFTNGRTETMKITGPAHLVKRLQVKLDEGELEVKLKPLNKIGINVESNYGKSDGVVLEVSAPVLNEIDVSSGGMFFAENLSDARKLEVDASSGGQIEIGSVVAGDFEAGASSGALIKVSKAQLTNGEADASSGASVVVLGITADKFEADASSGASIKLVGTSQSVEFDASSGGSVDARNLKADMADVEASSGGSVKYNARTTRMNKQQGVQNYWQD